MKHIIYSLLILLSVSLTAASKISDSDRLVSVITVKQDKIRSSYPFPDFLSTAPYVWYDNVAKTPIKGHAYRIASFSYNQAFRVFIEKVEFGDGGCCLEIIEYRELLINEAFLKKHFPHNTGSHGFKLLRWLKSERFEFEAYGGTYKLSQVGNAKPMLEELITESKNN
ncbi:MAG: hypothetical protein COA74_10405 [Gammaproteobacteria bacterium]|nr:MAG: hypothetical protein COA74_10405 [Gammaproteobacteria bacterium]